MLSYHLYISTQKSLSKQLVLARSACYERGKKTIVVSKYIETPICWPMALHMYFELFGVVRSHRSLAQELWCPRLEHKEWNEAGITVLEIACSVQLTMLSA